MPVSTIREQKTELYQLTDITINLQNIRISHCGNSYIYGEKLMLYLESMCVMLSGICVENSELTITSAM